MQKSDVQIFENTSSAEVQNLDSVSQVARTTLNELRGNLRFAEVTPMDSTGKPTELYLKLLSHRQQYYTGNAPHLLEKKELDLEQQVDANSRVFCVIRGDEILCSVRLTPRPFEIESHGIHDFDFATVSEHLEIGRLVVKPSLDAIASALIVRYAMCSAGLVAFEDMKASGLVAICRPFRLSFFTKFGMQKVSSYFSTQRGIMYFVLTATRDQIFNATSNLQINEEMVRRRLSRSTSLKAGV